jgi:hypothetical protein
MLRERRAEQVEPKRRTTLATNGGAIAAPRTMRAGCCTALNLLVLLPDPLLKIGCECVKRQLQ